MAGARLHSAALADFGPGAEVGVHGGSAGPLTGTQAEVSSGDIRPCSGKSGAQVAGGNRSSGP
jgi:hypothetical protein